MFYSIFKLLKEHCYTITAIFLAFLIIIVAALILVTGVLITAFYGMQSAIVYVLGIILIEVIVAFIFFSDLKFAKKPPKNDK